MKHIIITGFLAIIPCLAWAQAGAPRQTSGSENSVKISEISEVLPEGKYHLLFSPARPDLENLNIVPRMLSVEISHRDGQTFLTLDKTAFAITFSEGEIIFTLPTGVPGGYSNNQPITGATVFSGRPWSDKHPGRIVGRLWQIRGSRFPIEEHLCCLERIN